MGISSKPHGRRYLQIILRSDARGVESRRIPSPSRSCWRLDRLRRGDASSWKLANETICHTRQDCCRISVPATQKPTTCLIRNALMRKCHHGATRRPRGNAGLDRHHGTSVHGVHHQTSFSMQNGNSHPILPYYALAIRADLTALPRSERLPDYTWRGRRQAQRGRPGTKACLQKYESLRCLYRERQSL